MRSILRFLGHQRWLRFGVRDRIIRAFHNPDTCSSEPFEASFFGYRYPGNFSTFIDWNVYYYGAYSNEELTLMRDAVKDSPNAVILDIGANIGHHSTFAASVAKEVHSFEPYPLVRKKLVEKIQLNSIQNITVHAIGLGESNEDLQFIPPDNANTGTGTFINNKEGKSSILLPIRRGDDYFKTHSVKNIDFIKLDVEGFEPQALRGLKNTIETFRPVVFFEWSANEREIKIDFTDLFPKDYHIFNFTIDNVILGIFNNPNYKLTNNKGDLVADGNKLAIPSEKIKQFRQKITNS